MSGLRIALLDPDHLPDMDTALRALSAELGDRHLTGTDALHSAFFGPHPACFGLLAYQGAQPGAKLAGAVVFSPVLSTTSGGAGVQVTDLWVTEHLRSSGTGAVLLRGVANRAHALWQARFMWLSCYQDNHRALAFYARLGFEPTSGDVRLRLAENGFETLRRSK